MKKFAVRLISYYATHYRFPARGSSILVNFCKLLGIEDAYFLKRIPSGILFRLGLQDHIQKQIFWHDGYEIPETTTLLKMIPASGIFLDIGANIGYHTLCAAKVLRNGGQVIAFEPSPETFRHLQENIALNKFTNITAVQKGISDKTTTATFYFSGRENTGSSGLSPSGEFSGQSTAVELVNADDWLQQYKLAQIHAVKIDVEGHEMQVLQGLQQTLRQNRPVIMIEILASTLARFDHTPAEVYGFLNGIGYKAYQLNDANELAPVMQNQEGYCIFFLTGHHIHSAVRQTLISGSANAGT